MFTKGQKLILDINAPINNDVRGNREFAQRLRAVQPLTVVGRTDRTNFLILIDKYGHQHEATDSRFRLRPSPRSMGAVSGRVAHTVIADEVEPPTYKTVEVRDAGNPKRLLGTYRAPAEVRGIRLEAYVEPRLSPACYYDPYDFISMTTQVERVSFTVSQRPSEDGWDRIGILVTDAPLDLLQRVRGFKLPTPKGETMREEYERRLREGRYGRNF